MKPKLELRGSQVERITQILNFFSEEFKWGRIDDGYHHAVADMFVRFLPLFTLVGKPNNYRYRFTNIFRDDGLCVWLVDERNEGGGSEFVQSLPLPSQALDYSGCVAHDGYKWVIMINNAKPPWRRELALIHEMLHITEEMCGLEPTEAQTHVLATFLWSEILNRKEQL